MLRAFYISCIGTRKLPLIWVFFCTLRPQNRTPLKKQKEDRTKTNKTGSSNGSSRSMFWPSFIEFGQPRFPRSDTLSQSGPLKDDFQSELRSLRTLMFIGRTRWNANRCYSLRTTYLIFETFQSLFPTDSLIFTAVKLFHEVI